MKRLINSLCSFFKYILLIVSFGLTLFIILRMYMRLNKSLDEAIVIFLPYVILLILFIINSFFRRDKITKNLFYNLTATLVFTTNIYVCYRAIFDKNMLFNNIQKMGVNFNYFNDYLSFNRIMLYGLVIANIVFMILPTSKKSYNKEVARKLDLDQELI